MELFLNFAAIWFIGSLIIFFIGWYVCRVVSRFWPEWWQRNIALEVGPDFQEELLPNEKWSLVRLWPNLYRSG
jgi:hypothetical protein